jgi:phosphate starvation-inducible protein PhoH and related proteins
MSNAVDILENIVPVVNNREEFDAQTEKEIEAKKPKLRGLTKGQAGYIEAINSSVITFCTGPAGSGKSYIPVIRGYELLNENVGFKRMLVTRPTVECGNSLGFLPGDEDEKTAPYMRPIRDILFDVIDGKTLDEHLKVGTIEFCALAYMRGRSIHNTVMILDEAQNATWDELMMFLTRIGKNSKIIVSGDETQQDVFNDAYAQCIDKWDNPPYVDGARVITLTEKDIVRNEFIRKIIEKMGSYEPDYFAHEHANRKYRPRRNPQTKQ